MSGALDVGRTVAGWWLRVAVGVAAGAIALDLLLAGVPTPLVVVAGVLAALCVVIPASPVALVLIGTAALAAALDAPEPFSPAVLVLIPLAHALHLASAFAALLPRGSRISPGALAAPLRRAGLVQLGVGLAVVAATFLPTGRTAPGVELVALLSSAAVALAVILLERSRR